MGETSKKWPEICLLTPGQPSSNPRLVKEADALTDAGFKVMVVYGFWADWASKADKDLLASRKWTGVLIGGDPRRERLPYWFTRVRYGLSVRTLKRPYSGVVPGPWKLCRVCPELMAAARRIQ